MAIHTCCHGIALLAVAVLPLAHSFQNLGVLNRRHHLAKRFRLYTSWEDLSGDGGVLKRVLEPGANDGAAKPRHRSLCNVDFELRLVPAGSRSPLDEEVPSPSPPSIEAETVLGSATGYKFSLRATSEVLASARAKTTTPMVDASLPGFHLALPTMANGEVAELRLSPEYAFGAAGVPPRVPPNAAVACTLRLGFHQRYATGEVGKAEADAWADQVRADPLLKQSTIAACEKEAAEELAANAAPPGAQATEGAAKVAGDEEVAGGKQTERRRALEAQTVPELRALLKAKGLKVSGAKAALIERLVVAEAGNEATSATAAVEVIAGAEVETTGGGAATAAAAEMATAEEAAAAKEVASAVDVESSAAATAKPAKERMVLPADVEWSSVPASSILGDQDDGSMYARSARMFADEVDKSAVDPSVRVCGVESAPISMSVAAAAALDVVSAPDESGGPSEASAAAEAAGVAQRQQWLEGAEQRVASVSWDESTASLDLIVAFKADDNSLGGDRSDGGASAPKLVRASDLEVTIKARSFKVVYHPPASTPPPRPVEGSDSAGVVLAAGELCNTIDTDASFWWIEDPPVDTGTEEVDEDEHNNVVEDNNAEVSEGGTEDEPLPKFWHSGASEAVQAPAKANAAVRATLVKRRPAIWAGVWKAELLASRAEADKKE
jgi:hypothetical protein